MNIVFAATSLLLLVPHVNADCSPLAATQALHVPTTCSDNGENCDTGPYTIALIAMGSLLLIFLVLFFRKKGDSESRVAPTNDEEEGLLDNASQQKFGVGQVLNTTAASRMDAHDLLAGACIAAGAAATVAAGAAQLAVDALELAGKAEDPAVVAAKAIAKMAQAAAKEASQAGAKVLQFAKDHGPEGLAVMKEAANTLAKVTQDIAKASKDLAKDAAPKIKEALEQAAATAEKAAKIAGPILAAGVEATLEGLTKATLELSAAVSKAAAQASKAGAELLVILHPKAAKAAADASASATEAAGKAEEAIRETAPVVQAQCSAACAAASSAAVSAGIECQLAAEKASVEGKKAYHVMVFEGMKAVAVGRKAVLKGAGYAVHALGPMIAAAVNSADKVALQAASAYLALKDETEKKAAQMIEEVGAAACKAAAYAGIAAKNLVSIGAAKGEAAIAVCIVEAQSASIVAVREARKSAALIRAKYPAVAAAIEEAGRVCVISVVLCAKEVSKLALKASPVVAAAAACAADSARAALGAAASAAEDGVEKALPVAVEAMDAAVEAADHAAQAVCQCALALAPHVQAALLTAVEAAVSGGKLAVEKVGSLVEDGRPIVAKACSEAGREMGNAAKAAGEFAKKEALPAAEKAAHDACVLAAKGAKLAADAIEKGAPIAAKAIATAGLAVVEAAKAAAPVVAQAAQTAAVMGSAAAIELLKQGKKLNLKAVLAGGKKVVSISVEQLKFLKSCLLSALEAFRDFFQYLSVLVSAIEVPDSVRAAWQYIAGAISFNWITWPDVNMLTIIIVVVAVVLALYFTVILVWLCHDRSKYSEEGRAARLRGALDARGAGTVDVYQWKDSSSKKRLLRKVMVILLETMYIPIVKLAFQLITCHKDVRCWACDNDDLRHILQKSAWAALLIFGLGIPLLLWDLIRKNKPDERIAFDSTGERVTDKWVKQDMYMQALNEDPCPYLRLYKDIELKWAYLRVYNILLKVVFCGCVYLLPTVPAYLACCVLFASKAYFNLFSSPFLADLTDHLESLSNATHMCLLVLTALGGATGKPKTAGVLLNVLLGASCVWQFYKVWPYLKIWIKQVKGDLFFPDFASMKSQDYAGKMSMEIKQRVWCFKLDRLLATKYKAMQHRFDDIADQVKLVGRETFIGPVRWHAFNRGVVQYLLDHLEGNDVYFNSPLTKDAPFGMLETKRFPFGLTFVSDAGVRVEFNTRKDLDSTFPLDLIRQNNTHDPQYYALLQRRLTFRALCKENSGSAVAFTVRVMKQPTVQVIMGLSGEEVYDTNKFALVQVRWKELQRHTFKFVEREDVHETPNPPKPDGTPAPPTVTKTLVWSTREFEYLGSYTRSEWRPQSTVASVDEVDIEGNALFSARVLSPPTDYGTTTQRAERASCEWEQIGEVILGLNPPDPNQNQELYRKPIFMPAVHEPKPSATLINKRNESIAVDMRPKTFARLYTYEKGDFLISERGGLVHYAEPSVGARFEPSIQYSTGWAKDAYRVRCPNIPHHETDGRVFGYTPTFAPMPEYDLLVRSNLSFVHAGWARVGERLQGLRKKVAQSWVKEVGALSEKYWVDIYCNYHPQIVPYEVFLQHFKFFELDPVTQNFVVSEKNAITNLYEAIKIVSRNEVSKVWYLFFDEFYRLNASQLKKEHHHKFNPNSIAYLDAIAYRPLSRAELKVSLTDARLLKHFTPVLDDLYALLDVYGGVTDVPAVEESDKLASNGLWSAAPPQASFEKPKFQEVVGMKAEKA